MKSIYELAQCHLNSVISGADTTEQQSLALARALVRRERIPLIMDSNGGITTGMTAMSRALRDQCRWYIVDPTLLNVSYKVDSWDVAHWRECYAQQITLIGKSLNGQPSQDSLIVLTSLLEACRIHEFMSQAATLSSGCAYTPS